MKPARPVWEAMDTHAFGLGALLLALLVPASAWLVAYASLPTTRADDARRSEFVRATAGIQGRLAFLRQMERETIAVAASPGRSGYYRQRRDEARYRIDELTHRAAAVAEGAQEQARLRQLALLVRAGDARYERLLASAGEAHGARRLAMQK